MTPSFPKVRVSGHAGAIHRHVVEGSFATVKQWRGLATRYDKLAIVYRAGAILNAIYQWLKALRNTPYSNGDAAAEVVWQRFLEASAVRHEHA